LFKLLIDHSPKYCLLKYINLCELDFTILKPFLETLEANEVDFELFENIKKFIFFQKNSIQQRENENEKLKIISPKTTVSQTKKSNKIKPSSKNYELVKQTTLPSITKHLNKSESLELENEEEIRTKVPISPLQNGNKVQSSFSNDEKIKTKTPIYEDKLNKNELSSSEDKEVITSKSHISLPKK
jgi:hypothetical protein